MKKGEKQNVERVRNMAGWSQLHKKIRKEKCIKMYRKAILIAVIRNCTYIHNTEDITMNYYNDIEEKNW